MADYDPHDPTAPILLRPEDIARTKRIAQTAEGDYEALKSAPLEQLTHLLAFYEDGETGISQLAEAARVYSWAATGYVQLVALYTKRQAEILARDLEQRRATDRSNKQPE
jgi:hypothetical protein